ncbi:MULTISPECIES: hypothetical protein [Rhizobium/Agrobacterium group]|uniref:hypothetical protein n=1 Tax=Rhizobium/Agrobacterium group TaxID=227290 RepID=UPI000FDAABAE|nr:MULTISPECIES: hypothetical protein [Rhizobium/Agrobacterium group]MBB4403871.1 hypothetical protein [Agrobacterium radiobacter]MBB5590023.1 hypothetical protein [Agrobacterium radiobacter]MCZ4072381.1 hypothetical protein [Agrobacterium sp. LMR679]RVT71007.1 hypothetical protein EM858_23315 [Agrobacterium sp. CNPSo 2736]TGE87138.1 hypothetical protein C9418_21505 [Rhizobium sp. SEMIA 4032]
MLDIYYAELDTKLMPADACGLELAGSIDLDAHRLLAALFDKGRQAGAHLSYFEDTLLEPVQVGILLNILLTNEYILEGNEHALAAFNSMRDLLERAAKRGVGLLAFAD